MDAALVPVGPTQVEAGDIGGALVAIGAIPQDRLHQAKVEAIRNGQQLEDYLLRSESIDQGDLIQAASKAGLSPTCSRLADLPPWNCILNDEGQELAGSGRRDPSLAIIHNNQDRTRRCFLVVVEGAPQSKIQASIAKAVGKRYLVAAQIVVKQELLDVLYAEWDSRSSSKLDSAVDEADLHREFDRIALEAFNRGASDVHISCARGRGSIHLRVHGELEHYMDMTEEHTVMLCTSIYNTLTEAGSTKEGFNPLITQDAVIERNYKEGMIRFRYSGLPIAPSGFDVTLRIIPIGVTAKRKSALELGYSPDQDEALERIFSHSSGLILFAGTTGSGKSTSVASMLAKVAEERPGKKIRTVEEPVEYRIEGTYQTPVKRIKGDSSDFLTVLRQILRADPDITMVGEIRDSDTADLAIQAVRSGHLCVSTLHADGAPICYDRLAGMGISRLDMASVGLVVALIYQKLVPVLCDACKVPSDSILSAGNFRNLQILDRAEKAIGTTEGLFFRSSSGCAKCGHRGVTGRTVCAEILRPTPKMLKAVASSDSNELWQLWRETINENDPSDMTGRTAFEHAIWKMRQGIVSPVDVEAEFRYLDESPFEGLV